MYKRKSIILIFIIVISLGIADNLQVKAFEEREYKYTNEVYERVEELKGNVTFDGVFDSYSFLVNIEDEKALRDININLSYKATDILSNEVESYLTFSVKGSKFHSLQVGKEEVENLQVSIPKELLSNGINEIKVEGYLRLSDESCSDDYNGANWLLLYKGSNIKIQEASTIYSDAIDEFPYNFNKDYGMENIIIIKDNYSDEELSCAMNLSILLGNLNGEGRVVKWSEKGDLSNANVILIGEEEEVVINKGSSNLKEASLLTVMKSPFSQREDLKLISIISESGEMLQNNVRFLMNKSLYTQVKESQYLLDKTIDVFQERENFKNKVYLSDLSFEDFMVEGLFRREMSFSYSIPLNKRMTSEEGFTLNLRYSQNLDFDRSLFTLYINDIPIGSKKLEKEKCQEDIVEFKIPYEILDASYMNIKFAYDLYLKEVECERKESEAPWGLVGKDSYLQVATKERDDVLFNKYPFPFVSDYMLEDLYIIIPEDLNNGEISSISEVFLLMGKYIKSNVGMVNVVSNENVKEDHKKHNLILYGNPKNNKIIEEYNENLWVKYNDDYKYFLSNEKIEILKEYGENLAQFQLDYNKYTQGKYALVLTSPNKELLRESLIYLSLEDKLYNLSGDGVLIDLNGDLRCFTYKDLSKENPLDEKLNSLKEDEKSLLLIIILLAFFTIVGYGLFIYKNGRKEIKLNKKNN